jgi:predicted PurR-regulated permease PerM
MPQQASQPILASVSSRSHYSAGIELASLMLAGMMILAVLCFHLIPALFAGMMVFLLIHSLAKLSLGRLSSVWSKWLALMFISVLMTAMLLVLVLSISTMLKSDTGLIALLGKMAQVIEEAKGTLPSWLSAGLPSNVLGIQNALVVLLREHSKEMQSAGKDVGMVLIHLIIGAVIGAIIAFNEVVKGQAQGVLSLALLDRVQIFTASFRKVVFAQIKISAINTVFTAIYLVIILPLLGVHLPFLKTMLALTFLLGLLPVVGNLLSNTIVITVSMAHSFHVAMGSLVFLVLIHKAEYFLNAKIVGTQIKAKAWELLLAMLVMEAMFGLAGLALAPVLYAYMKAELRLRQLI